MCSECIINVTSSVNGRRIEFLDEIGVYHCDSGPAVIDGDYCEYYRHGERHRSNGEPAVIWADGTIEYWVDGERHRDGGLPAVIWSDGCVEYWVNGK